MAAAIVGGCVTRSQLAHSMVTPLASRSGASQSRSLLRPNELSTSASPAAAAVLASLSLRERIGQRFVVPIPGTRLQDGAGRAIARVNPAGFIVYPWNFRSLDDARSLLSSITEFASMVNRDLSPLIAADQEGGRVAAFRSPEMVRLPSAAVLGRTGDPSLVRAATYVSSVQLRELGVTMNFAPVLDVFDVADDSVIGDRSFGGSADLVTSFVRPALEASAGAGIIATAKHFPGHGVTTVDSHLDLPVVSFSRSELDRDHLPPFREAILAGVPAIMTGHLLFEEIDPNYPVTLSRVFLQEILRDELGFEGVVVTDGLEMAAIREHYTLEETLIRLFQNDVDLILLYREYDVVELVDLVVTLVRRGEVTENDIDRGVLRVLTLKERYGLLHPEAR